jgi:hypothetical protein
MAVAWIAALTALISTGGALLGVYIGGRITHRNQLALQKANDDRLRKSVAAALGAEIDAFLHLQERRPWEKNFRAAIPNLRNGVVWKSAGPGSLGFAPDEKPHDRFVVYQSQMASIGMLGPVCADVAKFYSLAIGVRSTVINAERGVFDNLTPDQKADLVDSELKVWDETKALGHALVRSLGIIAREP